jgi:parallel beta-helix repeat protein
LAEDPTASVVEIGTREQAIFFNSVPGSRLEGIGVRHYATAPGNRAAIEIRGGGVALVDVDVMENSNAGIQAIGPGIELLGVTARGNGRLGVNAHQADGLIVRDGTFTRNNNEGQAFGGAAGGLKVTASRDIVVEGTTSSDNGGSGIWIDMSSVGITISGNTTDHNSKAGVYVEVSAQAVVDGNHATGNALGIEIAESNDVVVRGNVVTSNTRGLWVVDSHRDGETCVDRGIGAVYTPPIDSRFGCQWPTVRWNIDNVEVTGNTLVGGDPSDTERAMLEVNDVGHPEGAVDGVDRRRPAEAMNIVVSDNHFERPGPDGPRWVVAWTGGQSMAVFETLSDFRTTTGQGAGSTESN